MRDVQLIPSKWQDLDYVHVGAVFSELEYKRYQPRNSLTKLLRSYDLIQFVVGSPPWACVAEEVDRPILIWTATTTRADRESQMHKGSLGRRLWSSLMVPIAEHFERRALQAADSVFALSEYTRDQIVAMKTTRKVLLAPCGVDTHLFRPSVKPTGNYILCVARLSDPRKNIRLLLEAYAIIRGTLRDPPELVLVGDMLTESDMQYVKAAQLADGVRVVGMKDETSLAELYRNARLFVLSSDEEGLGIVILEAMACGLPVVSTDCGGPATLVTEGKTGFLTPVGDSQALASKIQLLLTDRLLSKQLGHAGRQVADEQFSLSAAGQIFLDTYDGLLSVDESQRPSDSNTTIPLTLSDIVNTARSL
jgi:glycosyltransferase involved in cell wall biosynthesis